MRGEIYVYKCVVDDGVAPCVDRSRLSLTICKPQIRRTADVGDYLLAFGRNSETPPNRLVYSARITGRITEGRYFDERAYQGRQDCVYERTARGLLRLQPGAKVHTLPQAQRRDLGPAPEYPNAIALVSDDFRYFGGQGTDAWKEAAPRLARRIEKLGQGHRVNHSREIRNELLQLIARLWREFPRKMNGRPLHGTTEPCARKPKCETPAKGCP